MKAKRTSPRASRAGGGRQPRRKGEPRDARVLERSDTVLWSLAGDGIVLHNFVRRRFLHLDEVGYRAWAYLDGARTVEEVVALCCADGGRPQHTREHHVREIVETLAENGFIEERAV